MSTQKNPAKRRRVEEMSALERLPPEITAPWLSEGALSQSSKRLALRSKANDLHNAAILQEEVCAAVKTIDRARLELAVREAPGCRWLPEIRCSLTKPVNAWDLAFQLDLVDLDGMPDPVSYSGASTLYRVGAWLRVGMLAEVLYGRPSRCRIPTSVIRSWVLKILLRSYSPFKRSSSILWLLNYSSVPGSTPRERDSVLTADLFSPPPVFVNGEWETSPHGSLPVWQFLSLVFGLYPTSNREDLIEAEAIFQNRSPLRTAFRFGASEKTMRLLSNESTADRYPFLNAVSAVSSLGGLAGGAALVNEAFDNGLTYEASQLILSLLSGPKRTFFQGILLDREERDRNTRLERDTLELTRRNALVAAEEAGSNEDKNEKDSIEKEMRVFGERVVEEAVGPMLALL